MKSLYSEQLGVSEEDILDNYVALLRHAIGDERLFIRAKRRPTLPPELRELWRKELKTCERCGIVKFYPRHYRSKYCGNRITREGCAWIQAQEGLKRATEVRIRNKIKKGYGI